MYLNNKAFENILADTEIILLCTISSILHSVFQPEETSNHLTLDPTIPAFHGPGKKNFENIVG